MKSGEEGSREECLVMYCILLAFHQNLDESGERREEEEGRALMWVVGHSQLTKTTHPAGPRRSRASFPPFLCLYLEVH